MPNRTILDHSRVLYDYLHVRKAPITSDVMLVFGSIDLDVATYAAELFLEDYSKSWKVVVSGGIAHMDDLLATGWNESEARIFAREMVRSGINADAIILEDRATNSGENVRFSAEILQREGISRSSILIVHKPYMERRTLATFERQYLLPYDSVRVVSRPETIEEHIARSRIDPDRLVNILMGDVERMGRYIELGYQTDQWPLPKAVADAFDALVTLGYDPRPIQ